MANVGLMGGELTVDINFNSDLVADATLDYQGFSDVPGLTLDGPQLVNVSPHGDGHMAGTQLLSLAVTRSAPAFFSAELDYNDIVIKDGFGHSGDIPLVPEIGSPLLIPVDEALVVDFRGLLPLDQAAE